MSPEGTMTDTLTSLRNEQKVPAQTEASFSITAEVNEDCYNAQHYI